MEERSETRGRRTLGKKKPKKKESYFDYSLLFITIFLLCFGVVMIYSASSYEAQDTFQDAYRYVKNQIMGIAVGVVISAVFLFCDYHVWSKFSFLIYIGSIIAILLVMTPLGIEANGARRWLNLGISSFQPAELAKLAVILILATVICAMGRMARTPKGVILLFFVGGLVSALILLVTRNLSSALIIAGITFCIIFVITKNYKLYVALVAVAGVLGVVAVNIIRLSAGSGGGFRVARIIAWLNPEEYADTTAFQTLQALYAIGSGGFLGKGLGGSMQKLNFLPEAQNDMIFSIICEELGLFGAVAVLIMFILMIWRMMVIAGNAPDLFGALLVVGVMSQIAIQVILNVAVVTNSMPNTGISLPFISYGGTSVSFLIGEVALVLRVSSQIRLKEME